jgi:uncharacterized protein (TIGR02996 family)
MRAAPRRKVAGELLAEVYAHPDEDGPRLVYADALAEAGDPRGEFIVLQCERARTGGAPSRRERELLKGFERTWLGALEPVVLKSGVRYERGFVAACRYMSGRVDAAQAPEWATVVDLDIELQSRSATGSQSLPLKPQLRALRRVRSLQVGDLAAIARHGCALAWDFVSVYAWAYHQNELLQLLHEGVPSLPRLSGFGITHPLPLAFWEAAITSPTLARVAHVETLLTERGTFGDYWRVLSRSPALRTASLHGYDDTLEVTRSEPGSLALVLHFDKPDRVAIERLARGIESLAPGSVASLRLVPNTKVEGSFLDLEPLLMVARELGVEPSLSSVSSLKA